jgi:protein TonB
MSTLRLPFAASSGALITLAVFSLLWHLVDVPIELGPPTSARIIDWTRKIVDTPAETKRHEKPKREQPPAVPDPPRTIGGGRGEPPTIFERVTFDPAVSLRPAGGFTMRPDGDVIPIVRPPPEYPQRPLAEGIEGWVTVRFTVTTVGTVKDAVVVDADPPKVFDAAALKAIARWRYNPRVENGIAVERVGLQALIRFALEEE